MLSLQAAPALRVHDAPHPHTAASPRPCGGRQAWRSCAARAAPTHAGPCVGPHDAPSSSSTPQQHAALSRRQAFVWGAGLSLAVGASGAVAAPATADTVGFWTTPSGLRILDVTLGDGQKPEPGDTVFVHWSGYTKGYQGKRIDNTSVRDDPYKFVLGSGEAIKAFDEAVATMRVGGYRRIEVPGSVPELGYPLDRKERFTTQFALVTSDSRIYKYRYGPQPEELGGQRALDFVLDNATLKDFNRTLLFDLKLIAVRKKGASY